jgi:hypothetical protein
VVTRGTADVDAVLALAPCCGINLKGPYIPVTGFYDLLERVKAPRVMLFFFQKEIHAPDDIGRISKEILERNGVTNRIHHQPEGLSGHNAGLSSKFVDAFTQEMIDFASVVE